MTSAARVMKKNQAIQMQMKKFGWAEGQGLGKNEQGVKEAIKVSVKNNKNGLGLDQSEEFVFHWWDHVFNKVASSIKIKDVDGEVVVSKSKDASEVSNKRPSSTFAKKDLLYGRFVKSGTTLVGNDIVKTSSESIESHCEKEQEKAEAGLSNISTLDRAFEMSGGRTAHKAARHGNTLSGKLKRLQEQESRECPSSKKSKRHHKEQSSMVETTSESDLKLTKSAKYGMKESENKNRVSNCMIGSFTISANEQSLSNGSVIATFSSNTANEEPTLSKGDSSSYNTETPKICYKKKKSSEKYKIVKKISSEESDPVDYEKERKQATKSTINEFPVETKKAKKRKKKKKKNIVKNYENEEI